MVQAPLAVGAWTLLWQAQVCGEVCCRVGQTSHLEDFISFICLHNFKYFVFQIYQPEAHAFSIALGSGTRLPPAAALFIYTSPECVSPAKV
jgi:hypothetical protein